MGMDVFLQKEPKIPGAHKAHKLVQAFPALELRENVFHGHEVFFLIKGVFAKGCSQNNFPPRSVHGGHGLEETRSIPPHVLLIL